MNNQKKKTFTEKSLIVLRKTFSVFFSLFWISCTFGKHHKDVDTPKVSKQNSEKTDINIIGDAQILIEGKSVISHSKILAKDDQKTKRYNRRKEPQKIHTEITETTTKKSPVYNLFPISNFKKHHSVKSFSLISIKETIAFGSFNNYKLFFDISRNNLFQIELFWLICSILFLCQLKFNNSRSLGRNFERPPPALQQILHPAINLNFFTLIKPNQAIWNWG